MMSILFKIGGATGMVGACLCVLLGSINSDAIKYIDIHPSGLIMAFIASSIIFGIGMLDGWIEQNRIERTYRLKKEMKEFQSDKSSRGDEG